MANIPKELRYTREHEWAKLEGERVRVGITDYAQDALGDVVYVDLPDVGLEVIANSSIAEIESTKSVSEVYCPVTGTVVEVNSGLDDTPEALKTASVYPNFEGRFRRLVADAEAAGLRRAGPFAPGLGAHYINFANASGPPNGVMTDDWIARPLAWMYDGTKPTSRIAGLFYGSAVKDPEGFAGPNDVWHAHRNACIVQTPTGIDAPLGADQPVTKAQCDAVGGMLIRQTQQLLHVWVVPGYESPEGVYAHLSSAVTCDDGSYRVIEDLTKVGKRTSICLDGTE